MHTQIGELKYSIKERREILVNRLKLLYVLFIVE